LQNTSGIPDTDISPPERAVPAAGLQARHIFLFFILFFSIYQLPSHWPAIDQHDSGGQAAIEYWTLHHYQYGKDIVQNVGPLGFINYPKLYTGFLDGWKFALNLFLTVLFVILLLWAVRRIPSRLVQGVVLVNTALFASTWMQDLSYQNADTKLYLLLLLMSYVLFESDSVWALLVLVPTLALLSLAKGTLLHLAPVAVILSAANYAMRGKRAFGVAALLLYAACLLLFWVLCGQNLFNLPAFLGNSLGLTGGYANGYNESMLRYEHDARRAIAICVILTTLLAVATRALFRLKVRPLKVLVSRLSHLGMEALILFLVWKHGFVRADGHSVTFFDFLLVAGGFLFWRMPASCHPSGGIDAQLERPMLFGLIIVLAVSAYGMATSMKEEVLYPKEKYCTPGIEFCPEIVRNIAALANAPHYLSDLQQRFKYGISTLQLPLTRQMVGGQSIGYFGFLIAPMLYNDFNVHFMPNTMSFTGWDHESMENDAAFYRSDARAPDYLLYTQLTIDMRISAQDDALAQLEILQHYDPVLDNAIRNETKNRVLLKRRAVTAPLREELLGPMQAFPLSHWIDVPTRGADPIRVRMRLPKTPIARLLGALYKPPEYWIQFQLSDGSIDARKFMAHMAEDGFLIAPFIDTNRQFIGVFLKRDYERYLAGASPYLHRITRFQIVCNKLHVACSDRVEVEFDAVHGLDLGRVPDISQVAQ
jgi:hypothetical protein